MPNCLPRQLYHSAFPPAMNESSCCSTPLPVLGMVSVLDFGHSNRCVVVFRFLTCISLMTCDVKHLLIFLFAIDISSLERYLFRSSAHFVIWLFIFLLLIFKSSLYILDTSPLSDVCFAIISFSLWLVFLFS